MILSKYVIKDSKNKGVQTPNQSGSCTPILRSGKVFKTNTFPCIFEAERI